MKIAWIGNHNDLISTLAEADGEHHGHSFHRLVADDSTAVDAILNTKPQFLVVDVFSIPLSPETCLSFLAEKVPNTRILAFSTYAEKAIVQGLQNIGYQRVFTDIEQVRSWMISKNQIP